MKISISKSATEIGIAVEALRRWEAKGEIEVEHAPRGHRYDLTKLKGLSPRVATSSSRATLCYARVSRHDQKSDLDTQVAVLESLY